MFPVYLSSPGFKPPEKGTYYLVTKDGLRIELVESERGDVYFPLGSAQMTSTSRKITRCSVGEKSRPSMRA